MSPHKVPSERLCHDVLVLLTTGFVCVCASLVGCVSAAQAPDRATRVVRLTTGVPGAVFVPMGNALAAAYLRELPDLQFQTIPSSGTPKNLESLQQGDADVGFAYADTAYLSYVGKAEPPLPFDRIRAIAVLQPTVVHVLVGRTVAVDALQQLRRRRVAFGPVGSGTAITAKVLLKAFGIPSEDVDGRYLPFLDAANGLQRGELDAAFVIAGYPSESVLNATDRGARLLDIRGPIVERLRLEYPFLRTALIPARAYPGFGRPVHTVGIDTLMVCSADLDETLVYRLTRTFFDVLPQLVRDVDALRWIDVARAPATPIPLHPGAARYYRERELIR